MSLGVFSLNAPTLSAATDLKNWLSLCALAFKMKRSGEYLFKQRRDAEAGEGGGCRQKQSKAAKADKAAKAELEQSGVAKYLVVYRDSSLCL